MSRLHSVFIRLFGLVFLLSLSHCGGGASLENTSLGAVPDSWGKYLTPGGISATLDVYRSTGELETQLGLTVDTEQGTVSAPQFKIPIGDTYRFIIVFNYAINATEAIPYAYADFSWLVDEFSEAVTFSENEIRYDYDTQDPLVSASISEGKIPNLDLDGDGWTNWEELRDKVDPKSSGSVPIQPSVEVRGQQDGAGATSATIVVTARDNAHVEILRLVDPLCGVTVISDTLVNNVDGSVTRTLTLRLDLLSVSKNPRGLQGLADDGVTPAQNANETLSFSLGGSASQPYFVFTEPEDNAEVEGNTVFRGIACSRNDIVVASTRFLHPEIDATTWSGVRNSLNGDYELESAPVDTTRLPDGPINLKVQVEDDGGKLGQGSRSYRVINDNQVKLVTPVGRRWVFGNEQIAVTVKNLPDSNLVVIEGNPNFSLTSSTAGGAVGTLSVGNLPEGTVLPLTFKAIRSDGTEITRQVEFTVRNKPQVQVFQPEASEVFRNWSTNLVYRVINVDPAQLFVDGVSTGDKGERLCEEDGAAQGITVCSGKFPVKISQTEDFNLSAARLATSEESCINCIASTDTGSIQSINTLPKDIPEINAAIVGDDEPDSPSRIIFPNEAPQRNYRLQVKDTKDGVVILSNDFVSNDTVLLNSLAPRRDYLATLQILNGPGGNVVAEMFKGFTTGDLGLVGWWRFKDNYLAFDCPGESGFQTICDYSGRNNHGDPFTPGASWIEPGVEFLDGAMDFNGVDGYVYIPSSSSLAINSEFTVSCLINLNHKSTTTSILTKDSPSPGPYTLDQTSEDEIYFGIYTTISSVGSWKAASKNFSSYIGTIFRVTGTYGAGSISLYFNDQLQEEVLVNGSVTNNSQPLLLGRSMYHQSYFSGIMDECVIFNRVVPGNEI